MPLFREHFHWKVLLRWDVFGYLVALLLPAGAIMLAIDQFAAANICFAVTAIICFAKIAHIAIISRDPWWQRMVFTFLLFGLVGVGIVETVRAVNRFATHKATEKTTVAKKEPTTEESSKPPAAEALHAEAGSAIENLARLGWNLKTDDKAGITFEIAAKPLPNMKESASYFRQLTKPFRLHLQQIPSISGLSFLFDVTNCVALEISASDIYDVSELHGLTSLRTLIISQTPLTVHRELAIDAISSLVDLEALNLNMSRVNNIEPLRGLTKLRSLNIGGSWVRDLSPIKYLTLMSIDVRDSNVNDLSALEGDTELEEVSVDEKQLSSLRHLSRLPNSAS